MITSLQNFSLRHWLVMQTTIFFTLLKYPKRKMTIAINVNIAKPEWQKKLQNQHSTMAGCCYSEGFRTFGSQTNGSGLWLGQGKWVVRDPFDPESLRISTLNDVSKSNTEGKKRTNNHYQNAE